ncbi:MAG: Ig-like domain-containing protein [Kiritimatiellae bacterium]|nr:Ig-like domain-containing protein [Kiritimatiellia bacterium]
MKTPQRQNFSSGMMLRCAVAAALFVLGAGSALAAGEQLQIVSVTGSTTFDEDTVTTLTVTVDDANQTFSNLVLTATSSNAALIPVSRIVITKTSHYIRTVKLTPLSNENGSCTITLTLRADGNHTATRDVSITVRAVPDPPVISGFNGINLLDTSGVVKPFSAIVITDPDHGHNNDEHHTVTVTYNNTALPGEFDGLLESPVEITGTPNEVQAQLRSFKFAPFRNQVPVGDSKSVSVTIHVKDLDNKTAEISGVISVKSINDPPTISVTVSPKVIDDTASASPFSITVIDPDVDESFTVTIFANDDPTGKYGALVPGSSSFVGNALAVQSAVAALKYVPIPNVVAGNKALNFTFSVADGHGGTAAAQGQLKINEVSDPPSIAGIYKTLIRTDDATPVTPFTTVSITDPDREASDPLTVTVTVSDPTLGSMLPATISGAPPAAATAWLRGAQFVPNPNSIAVGVTEVVVLTVTVKDSAGNTRFDNQTRVAITGINGAPVFVGVPAPGSIVSISPADPRPFEGISVMDDDSANVVLVIGVDNPDKGALVNNSGESGFSEIYPGNYTFTGDLAAISNLLSGLQFVVNAGYPFPADSPGDTTFTLTATDTLGNSADAQVRIRVAGELKNLIVTHTTDDYSAGSLRHAVMAALAGDHVTFALPHYPALMRLNAAHGPVVLKRHVTLKRPGADMLAISGDTNGDGVPELQLFQVGASVVMEGLTLESGVAQTGGAVSVELGASLTMIGCVVKDCVATLWGGGIDAMGQLFLRNCLIKNNQTAFASGLGGGGISLYSKLPCSFINTTFAGNQQLAPTGFGGGGALFVENSDPQVYFYVDIQHCTFAENSDASLTKLASSLSVIAMGSTVRLQNNIFADGNGRNIQLHSGSIISLGGNLSDDAATVLKAGATDSTQLLIDPSDQVNVANLGVGALSLLQGSTEVYPLLAASPAINAGKGSLVGDDQRGVHRMSTPDSGAFEAGALTRVVINEIQGKDQPCDFIELYVPRDSTTIDLSGYQLLVDGALRHTFGATAIAPGNGIIVADQITLDTGGILVVAPNQGPLGIGSQGTVVLLNPAGHVVMSAAFVDNFPELTALDLTGCSLTLAPQFSGCAYLPHLRVLAPPFGGWDGDGVSAAKSSAGRDTGNTPFGAENASPIAIDDNLRISEDMLTLIPVTANDLDADGSDVAVITGLPTAPSVVTALGAAVWVVTNPVTGYGEAVFYEPRSSQIFNALPTGVEVEDNFTYMIADVGSAPIAQIVLSAGGDKVQIMTIDHRLSNGAMVQIFGTANYDGIYAVSSVTSDSFVIDTNYVEDESAGSWIARALRGASDSATVNITVIGANDYPVAGADAFTCNEKAILRILADPASGVVFDDVGRYPVPVTLANGYLLRNDTDVDTDDSSSSLLVVGVLDHVTAIDSFSGTAAFTPVTVHSTAHGLSTGTRIVISGYAGHPSYNGTHVVTVVDADQFTIPVVYVDNASPAGVWGALDDDSRLTATSMLGASVTLDIRVQRAETHLIYNPRGSETLRAISAGAFLMDTFYYALSDSHGAISIGQVDITVAGENDDPVVNADPDSLRILNPLVGGGNTLATVLSGLTVVDAVAAASGVENRADVRVFAAGKTEADAMHITDAWFVKESDLLLIDPLALLANDSDIDSDDTLSVTTVFNSHMGVAVTLGTEIVYDAAASQVLDRLAQGEQVLDFFEAVVSDAHGGFVTNLVAVIVEGVNDTPVSFDDNVTINEDVELFAFDPRAVMTTNDPSGRFSYTSADPNDYDVDINNHMPDNALWVVPTNGTPSAHLATYSLTNNLMQYYPFTSTNTPKHAVGPHGLTLDGLAENSQLVDTIMYTVCDQSLIFAENDLFRVAADGTGYVLDVLANDRNYNLRGGRISISAVGVPDRGGAVALASDGSHLVYTPAVNFAGDETFVYTITDPYNNRDQGRVTVRVTTELFNGDLQANDDVYSVALGETVTLDVLANDNRLPGSGSALTITSLLTTNQPHITLAGNKIVYCATNPAVSAETFSYEVAGTAGGSARAVANVAVKVIDRRKKLPVQDDFFNLPAGSVGQPLDVMANDFILPMPRNYAILSIDSTPHGTVVIDTINRRLLYTAPSGFVGRDLFGYTITDHLGGTGSGTVTIDVGVLTAVDDVYSLPQTAGTYTLAVLDNDMTLPGSIGSVTITELSGSPANGTVTVASGYLIFTANGTPGAGTFSYVISDGARTATAQVTVNTVADGLHAVKDTFSVLRDSDNITLPVLRNDRSLPEIGRVLKITAVGTGVNAPDHGGTVVCSSDSAALIYTPAPGFNGEESFTYTMTDTRFTDEARVVVRVGLPVLAVCDDRFAVYHEGPLTGAFTLPVLANDTFLPDQGGWFEIVGVGIEGNAPDHSGTLNIASDRQTLIYQPDVNYVGSLSYTERFTYEVGDGTAARVQGTVEVQVYPFSEERLPECNPDAFSVGRNSINNVLPVIANDGVLPDSADTWRITAVSATAFGGVATIVGSTIVYTPRAGFQGTDTFTYDVNNRLGSTVQGQVTVKVGSLLLNSDEYVVISETGANELDVLLNDGTLPGPEFTPVIDTNAASASIGAVFASTNRLFYTPSSLHSGAYPYVDTLVYGVIDQSGITQTQRVRVLVVEAGSDQSTSAINFTVIGVNDLPVLHNFEQLLATTDKQSIAPFPQNLITDVDGWGTELLRVKVQLDDPNKGALTNLGSFVQINPGEYEIKNVTPASASAALQGLTYLPVENRITVGTVEDALFTCRVWDPFVTSPVVSNTTVRVTPVNDPPAITGTQADLRAYAHLPILPFAAVTISEIDDLTLQPLVVEIRIEQPAHGYLATLGLFTSMGGGVYRASNVTAAQVSDSLQSITFEPTPGERLSQTSPSEITRLVITVDDGFAAPVIDSLTTIISSDSWVSGSASPWGQLTSTGFGSAVSNTRDIIAVGSPDLNKGAVSLYYRNQGGSEAWGFFKNIIPTNVSATAEFGHAVAIQDDLLAVGAPNDAGVGAVLIYRKDNTGSDQWGLITKLRVANSVSGARFGCSVAVSGETLIVGASHAFGNIANSGRVYIYRRSNSAPANFALVESLVPTDNIAGSEFGAAVAINSNRIIVGAPHDSSVTYRAGSAYTFARNSALQPWFPVQKLAGETLGLNEMFGSSVDIYEDVAVVGTPRDGANINNSGSVYLYRDSGAGTAWIKQKELSRPDNQGNYFYGKSVQIDRGILVVGSPAPGGVIGEVFVYRENEGGSDAWGLIEHYIGSGESKSVTFGSAVSLEQQTLAVCSAVTMPVYVSSIKLNVYRFKFNNAPVVALPVEDQRATVLVPFELTVDGLVFADVDFEDALTLSTIMPASWLSFDPGSGIFSGIPISTGTVAVTLIATDLDGLAATNTFSVTVVAPPGGVDPHAMWLAQNFGAGRSAANSAGQIWAKDADPDNDDLTNDQEYAFVSDPLASESAADHILAIQMVGKTALKIRYRCRNNDPALHFVLEKSTDLYIWSDCSPLIIMQTVHPLSTEAAETTVTLVAPAGSYFFRVKVYGL